jgi:hypothetical protein
MSGGRKRSISSRPPCDRIRGRIHLAIPALLLSLLIGSAIAAPIPAERQAGLLAPSFPNPNAMSPDRFTVIETYDTSCLGRDMPRAYGRSDLIEEDNPLTLLMLTSFSDPVTNSGYSTDPATQMPVTPSPRNPVSWIFVLGGMGMVLFTIIGQAIISALILALITAGLSRGIGTRSPPRIRTFLPLIIAVCLIVAIIGIFPVVNQSAAEMIESGVVAALISMGVLTPWPLFEGLLKAVKRRTAVFVCGIGTFFILRTGIIPLIIIYPFLGAIEIVLGHYSPSIVQFATLRCVMFYLESVVLAIVFFSVILFWDRSRRPRQNHASAEGRDGDRGFEQEDDPITITSVTGRT